jgi:hypothetical protein
MACPCCGKNGTSVFKCTNCGDVRCTSCEGISKKGGRPPGNYNQLPCALCRKKEIKRL